jgi:hypothetical protein
MSVTSSIIFGRVVNSCEAPSILIAEIAAPSSEERRILRSEFPILCANPLCRGAAVNLP